MKLTRNSRATLKKYVLANNKGLSEGALFDSQFNRALRNGVEKGTFEQPKGTCRTSRSSSPTSNISLRSFRYHQARQEGTSGQEAQG